MMNLPDLRPNQPVLVLLYPESTKNPRWVRGYIEDVLSSQVTINRNGKTIFRFKSEYGLTWKTT